MKKFTNPFTMSARLRLMLLALMLNSALSGQNIVINPSFENNSPGFAGPQAISSGAVDQLTLCCPSWSNSNQATSDYHHELNNKSCPQHFWTGVVDVPNNAFGSQPTITGHGYAGIVMSQDQNWYEYIQGQMTPMLPGAIYRVSFWVNLAEVSNQRYKNLGVVFHNLRTPAAPYDGYYQFNSSVLTLTPQAGMINSSYVGYTNSVDGWEQLVYTYTATGGEDRMIIGYFGDPTVQNQFQAVTRRGLSCPNAPDLTDKNYAYYYIEDVSVVEDPVYQCCSDNKIKVNLLSVKKTGSGCLHKINIQSFTGACSVKSFSLKKVDGNTIIYQTDLQQVLHPGNTSEVIAFDPFAFPAGACTLTLQLLLYDEEGELLPCEKYFIVKNCDRNICNPCNHNKLTLRTVKLEGCCYDVYVKNTSGDTLMVDGDGFALRYPSQLTFSEGEYSHEVIQSYNGVNTTILFRDITFPANKEIYLGRVCNPESISAVVDLLAAESANTLDVTSCSYLSALPDHLKFNLNCSEENDACCESFNAYLVPQTPGETCICKYDIYASQQPEAPCSVYGINIIENGMGTLTQNTSPNTPINFGQGIKIGELCIGGTPTGSGTYTWSSELLVQFIGQNFETLCTVRLTANCTFTYSTGGGTVGIGGRSAEVLTAIAAESDHTANKFTVYPNPFEHETLIQYTLQGESELSLELYSITGKLVQVIEKDHKNKGSHEVKLRNDNLSKGMYFLRLSSRYGTSTVKVQIE